MSQNIEMNYFNGKGYEVLYPTASLTNTVNSLSAMNVSYSNSITSSLITSNQVQGAIDQLFQSVSNGKSLIAEAITDKGVSTSSSASFATMASNIENIEVGTIIEGKVKYEGILTSGLAFNLETGGNSSITKLEYIVCNNISYVPDIIVLYISFDSSSWADTGSTGMGSNGTLCYIKIGDKCIYSTFYRARDIYSAKTGHVYLNDSKLVLYCDNYSTGNIRPSEPYSYVLMYV